MSDQDSQSDGAVRTRIGLQAGFKEALRAAAERERRTLAQVLTLAAEWWLAVRPQRVVFVRAYRTERNVIYDAGDEIWLPPDKARNFVKRGDAVISWRALAEQREQGRRRDPSRPGKGEGALEYLTLKLPQALHAALNEIADGERRSMAAVVEEALAKWLRQAHSDLLREAMGQGSLIEEEGPDIEWALAYRDAEPAEIFASELGRALVVVEENHHGYLDEVMWILRNAGVSSEAIKPLFEGAKAEAARRGRFFSAQLGLL